MEYLDEGDVNMEDDIETLEYIQKNIDFAIAYFLVSQHVSLLLALLLEDQID